MLVAVNTSLLANTLNWTSANLYEQWSDYFSLTTEVGSIGDVVWTDMEVSNLVGPGIGTLSFPSWSISYAEKYYLVNSGDAVDANLVNTGTPIVDNSGSSIYEMPISPNQTFMLGYWVDQDTSSPYTPTVDDYYCWAQLQWTGSDLVLLKSAGVSGAGGLYAGTWDVIPEPTTIILFLLGGFCIFIKRKFTKQ